MNPGKKLLVLAIIAIVVVVGPQLCSAQNGTFSDKDKKFVVNYQPQKLEDKEGILFEIKAELAVGWVGIGINNVSDGMKGADIFQGYFDATTAEKKALGWDRYLPENSDSRTPNNDTTQDWKVQSGKQEVDETTQKTTTTIIVWRAYDTGDALQDIVIPDNKGINVIWAYREGSNKIDDFHTDKGQVKNVNLRGSGNGNETETGTTEKGTGSLISVGMKTFLVGVGAALLNFLYELKYY